MNMRMDPLGQGILLFLFIPQAYSRHHRHSQLLSQRYIIGIDALQSEHHVESRRQAPGVRARAPSVWAGEWRYAEKGQWTCCDKILRMYLLAR